MSFKELLSNIESSQEYKKFKKEYPKAILYSAFFLLRQAFGNLVIESEQLDYFLGQEKVATFSFQDDKAVFKIDKLEPSTKKERKIKSLDRKIKIDINQIIETIKKEIKKEKAEITDISKVIVILQNQTEQEKNKNRKSQIWNISCIIGLSLLRLYIDMSGKILEKKKQSLFDMMKVEKRR